ncbi:MAG: hypothetical protein VXZ40_02210 [Nanoarchaeota archaeon]|nr:hypothetical protein [Nanoarchaeota archaeon]
MNKEIIKQKVNSAINKLYQNDKFLFDNDLCERCIVHRLAVCLEREGFEGYYVDCEYNKSHLNKKTGPKVVSNLNGNYIDIVITKRNENGNDDLVCFEIKKYNNYSNRDKDRENLCILTNNSNFYYNIGYYIILGKTEEKTKIELYENGRKIISQ